MNHTSELKDRILARKKVMEAKLLELRANQKGAATDKITNLESELSRLKDMVKDGFENLTEDVAAKLNEWLTKNKE